MSAGHITRYVEGASRIARYTEAREVPAELVHPCWTTITSQRSVRGIAVAPRSSHVWLATWGGVLALDRKELVYRRYGSEHGLAGNGVVCICLDKDNRPWTGHDEGGLSYFDGRHWHIYSRFREEPIQALCSACDSGVLVATACGVYHVAGLDCPPVPLVTKVPGREGPLDAKALLAEGNRVWVADSWGLYLHPDNEPRAIRTDTIGSCVALARDGEGGLWAATPQDVYSLIGDCWQGPFVPPGMGGASRILGLAAGKKQVHVLTTDGLARLTNGQWQPIPPPAGSDGRPGRRGRVLAAGAADGYLWVGIDSGLAVVYGEGSRTTWDFQSLPTHRTDGLNNLARCALPDPRTGRLLVGTAGGLLCFGPGEDEWTLDGSAGDVRSLCLAGDMVALLVWPQGIGRLSTAGRIDFFHPQPPGIPLALASDRDSRLHCLTTRGLCHLDGGSWVAAEHRGADGMVRCLVQARDRQWWLGTTRGVYRLMAGHWEPLGADPGPLQSEVYGFAVTADTFYAATETGLWMCCGTDWQQRTHFPVRTLTPAGDSGALWLAHPEGIARFDPHREEPTVLYTTVNSGLASKRITAIASRADRLWIVGEGGISQYTLPCEGASHA